MRKNMEMPPATRVPMPDSPQVVVLSPAMRVVATILEKQWSMPVARMPSTVVVRLC